jgi:hypothetical protein
MPVRLTCRLVVAHPIIELRHFIERELTTDLPEGVHPVSEWCADPQFFPGATGLVIANSWDEVVPGSQGLSSSPPPAHRRGAGSRQLSGDTFLLQKDHWRGDWRVPDDVASTSQALVIDPPSRGVSHELLRRSPRSRARHRAVSDHAVLPRSLHRTALFGTRVVPPALRRLSRSLRCEVPCVDRDRARRVAALDALSATRGSKSPGGRRLRTPGRVVNRSRSTASFRRDLDGRAATGRRPHCRSGSSLSLR